MNPWGNLAKACRRELEDLQNRKLHHFINHHVYPFSTAYQQLFKDQKINPKDIRTVKDLARLPFTTKLNFIDTAQETGRFKNYVLQPDKEKIRKHWPTSKVLPLLVTKMMRGEEFVQDVLAREYKPVFMTFTTGTTNKPVPFLYSNYDLQNLRIYGARMVNLFDVDPSKVLLNMFPYAPHLAFWQVVFGGFEANVLALSTGGGKVMGTEGNVGAILKMKPEIILGVPSYVYHVLRAAKEQNCDLSFLKKIVLGASRITPGFKLKLGELIKSMGAKEVNVFGTYGFTESRCAWAECPTGLDVSSGYHLYPDKEIIEIIDPQTCEVKGEGQDGEIVYTSLDARASAMLRYRTGDFAKGGITWAPCPHCKRTVPRLSSDIVRLSDVKDLQLSKIKGSLVNMNHFDAILSDMALIEEWQMEIRKKDNDPYEVDEVVLYVCPRASCDQTRLADDIKKALTLATEVAPNEIKFITMPEMVKKLQLETANKEKRILDNRPKD